MLGNQLTDNQPKPLPTTVLQTPPLGPFQTANMTSLPDLESERDTLSRFLITLAQQRAPGRVSQLAPVLHLGVAVRSSLRGLCHCLLRSGAASSTPILTFPPTAVRSQRSHKMEEA